jgi:hypothetical protein
MNYKIFFLTCLISVYAFDLNERFFYCNQHQNEPYVNLSSNCNVQDMKNQYLYQTAETKWLEYLSFALNFFIILN